MLAKSKNKKLAIMVEFWSIREQFELDLDIFWASFQKKVHECMYICYSILPEKANFICQNFFLARSFESRILAFKYAKGC